MGIFFNTLVYKRIIDKTFDLSEIYFYKMSLVEHQEND